MLPLPSREDNQLNSRVRTAAAVPAVSTDPFSIDTIFKSNSHILPRSSPKLLSLGYLTILRPSPLPTREMRPPDGPTGPVLFLLLRHRARGYTRRWSSVLHQIIVKQRLLGVRHVRRYPHTRFKDPQRWNRITFEA